MSKKIIFTILPIILIFILHQSLILKLNWRLNFWPVILVFILFIFDYKLSLIWALTVGFLLDLYSSLPFGFNLVILFLLTLTAYLLIRGFVTNRSFLSLLILAIFATLFYNIFIFLSQELLIWLIDFNKILTFDLSTIFVQIVSNAVLTFLLFISTLKLTKRFQNNFFNPSQPRL